VVGLSGVVINDSIIMVSFIKRKLQEHKNNPEYNIIDGVVKGAGLRLRPILLTTITTVVGLLPTVYGIGGSAMILMPTVLAMSYGLLFGTLLTLFFIPALFMTHEDVGLTFVRIGETAKNIRSQVKVIKFFR